MAEKIVVADLEGDGFYPAVTRLWQLSITTPEDPEGVVSYNEHTGRPLAEGFKRLREAERVVWHNGLGYDVRVLAKLYPKLFSTEDWRKTYDTWVLSCLWNPTLPHGHSLDSWGQRLKRFKPSHEDWSKWSPAMAVRCDEDTVITAMLFNKLKYMIDACPLAVQIEHATAWEAMNMRYTGFRLDVDAIVKPGGLLENVRRELEAAEEELYEAFPPVMVPVKPSALVFEYKVAPNRNHPLHGLLDPGVPFCPLKRQEFNPNSGPQITKRFQKKYGWKPAVFTETGLPATGEDVMNDLPYPEAKVLVRWQKANKKLATLAGKKKANGKGGGWLEHVDPFTHRVHPNLQWNATVTARPTCSSPNLQQVDTGTEMRRVWLPGKGRTLIGVDSDSLELRCLGHYLAPLDGGKYGHEVVQGDVHTFTMNLLGMRLLSDPEGIKKINRNNTKRVEYAFLYGAGDQKLGLIVQQNAWESNLPINYAALGLHPDKKHSLMDVGAQVREKLLSGIDGLGKLTEHAKTRARQGRFRALDGRRLFMRSEHSALNSLLQSAGIITIKAAIMLYPQMLEDAGYRRGKDWDSLLWIHDEIQLDAVPEVAEEVGTIVGASIARAGELLKFNVPLSGTPTYGSNWAETH